MTRLGNATLAPARNGTRPPPAPRPGTLLDGRYRIQRPLGTGGMGRIWAARDEQLGRPVAVKVLRASLFRQPGARSQFVRESRLLARLDHPGVVRLHEAVTDGPVPYLVTQLIDGERLSDLIRALRARLRSRRHPRPSRDLSPDDLLRLLDRPVLHGFADTLRRRSWCGVVAAILAEVARALEAVHGAGVIHRDIKGSNVLLAGGGHPVLIDFGLGGSKGVDRDPIADRLSGTLRCIAPEQLDRQRMGNDPRTDVYQTGLLLYELLTLREAFGGRGAGEVLTRVRLGRFCRPRELDRGIPAALESICLRAMTADPERRYPSARALRRELESFAARRRRLAGRILPLVRSLGRPRIGRASGDPAA